MGEHFKKHKFLYLLAILLLTCAFSIFTGPIFEVYLDLRVSPPNDVRHTDFSWITVNEWFETQARVITSYKNIKQAAGDLGEEKLKQLVTAKRLDSADIIRVSAKGRESSSILEKAVTSVADAYLKSYNASLGLSDNNSKEQPKKGKSLSVEPDYKQELQDIYKGRKRLQLEMERTRIRVQEHENELKEINDDYSRANSLEATIAKVNNQLAELNQKLVALTKIYAEGWPEVIKIKEQITAQEDQRRQYSQELTAERAKIVKGQNEKSNLKMLIKSDADAIFSLKKELEQVNDRADRLEEHLQYLQKDIPIESLAITKEETLQAYIINPPTINFLPDLWMRFLFGAIAGFIPWYIIYLALKK
ncbi:MAG: hypothetical protein WC546_04845 [Candidatus Omnitrophota bacterium]